MISVVNVLIGAAGVLVTVATIVITVRQRRRKELSYGVVARTALLSTNRQVSKLEIVFDGQPVNDVYLVACALENTGNSEILREDFGGMPIRLVLPESAESQRTRLLSAECLKAPAGAPIATTVADNSVEIAPLLLNSRDRVVIQVAVAGSIDGDILMEARIAGVGVKKLRLKIPTWWIVSIYLAVVAGYAVFMLGLVPSDENVFFMLAGGVLIFALPVLLAVINRRIVKRREDLSGGLPDES